MHAYHGKDERRVPPLILGHEVSGKIINGKLKDKTAVLNPLITCGNCEYCTKGREHLCQERVLLGMNKPYERQGAFAELITVPDQNIYEIPEKLDIKEATIAEPTASGLVRRVSTLGKGLIFLSQNG
jgi:threonine dehydrogenase-like Zn-dependent dehydrogenase